MQTRLNVPDLHHALMQLVLDDPALQARLGTILESDVYERELRAIGAEQGLSLPADALTQLFAPAPLGLPRFHNAPVETIGGWPGAGWIPTRSVLSDSPEFDWSWFGDRRTDAPFFEDSIRQANAFPFDRMFRTRTNLDALIAGLNVANSVPLCGFIYHMSRCGSTLLARMLGAPAHHIVASEPEPLDMIIKWAETTDAPYLQKLGAIRAMVAALGRRRNPGWSRFFIKLDSWHILSHRLLRDAFPDVPWVFLHRDPVEVLVSLSNEPGMQSVPGMLPAKLIGIDNAMAIPQDEYCATLLARFCEAALDAHRSGGGLIVDYEDVKSAGMGAIPRHFGFVPDAMEQQTMAATTQVHSKNPLTKFASDSAQKQSGADARTQQIAQTHLARLRKRLQDLAPV